jgi:Arc/MetJ-type ribon-helix-helix transcriptional regulator
MSRTQIYLGPEEIELLDRATRHTGASRSELIRRAVRQTFGRIDKAAQLRALDASAGSWRGASFTGDEYVNAIRSAGVGEGLRKLGRP